MKTKTKTSGSNATPLHPRPTPNYMKSTITSDAKTEQSKKTGSSRPTLVRKNTRCGNSEVERATCSSTMKGIYPGLEGTSVEKVCRYSYCSIDGHHRARLPPLKSFVSARRRALKPPRSIDRKEPEEIGTRPYIIPKSDDKFGCFFDEISVSEDSSKSLKSETLFATNNSWDNYMECSNNRTSDNCPKMALEPNWHLESLVPGLECDNSRRLNPSGLQLLPPEPEPGAEKVNLRHQEVDARKNVEEWMVDYALRQAVNVTKGDDSSRQRRVALLVEAFEKVQLINLS